MLEVIESDQVAIVITKDLSRFGRNSALTGMYINFVFAQHGVRYIAINDNYDTIDPNSVDNDFAGIKNWFNEFYARDTSRKIRAVVKAKGERGEHLTANPPYGYVKDPENPKQWIVDEEAAQVVRRIFALCMEGRGPTQIGSLLEKERVPTPTMHQGKPSDYPCKWDTSTVVHILERREYTGCTVNFKTYTNSIWDKKQRKTPEDERIVSTTPSPPSSRRKCSRRSGRYGSSAIAGPAPARAASFPAWFSARTAARKCTTEPASSLTSAGTFSCAPLTGTARTNAPRIIFGLWSWRIWSCATCRWSFPM